MMVIHVIKRGDFCVKFLFIIIVSMGITYINYVSYVNKINDVHFPYKTSFDKFDWIMTNILSLMINILSYDKI